MAQILVIDDDSTVRSVLRKALSDAGFSVLEAENGIEGVRFARAYLPDLIISDVNMRHGDGYAALESLRSDPKTALIPFILMTGEPTQEGMRRGMNEGADDYLHKPFDVPALLATVDARLKRQQLIEQEVKKTEARLIAIFEKTPDLVAITDKDQRCLYLNEAGRAIFGIRLRDDLSQRRLQDFFARPEFDRIREEIAHALSTTGIWSGETKVFSQTKGEIPVLQVILAHKQPDNTVEFYSTVARDITQQKLSEATLRERESRFRALLEAIQDYSIYLLDAAGHIVTWNTGAQRIKGYEQSEVLGRHYSFLCPPTKIKGKSPEHQLKVAAEQGRFEAEGWRYRKDGSKFWATVVITSFCNANGDLGGFAIVVSDRTEAMRTAQALRDANERLQTLSSNLVNVQETERRHLARELHDEIGQALTATKINLETVQHAVSVNAGPLAHRLQESVGIVNRLLDQVRHLSLDLRPPMLDDLGLIPALRWYVSRVCQRAELCGQFSAGDDLPRFSSTLETACFRVAQEALTNVSRHAYAKNVVVKLEYARGGLRLIVRDDGVGFDFASARTRAEKGTSLGILGMEERVSILGGTFKCKSKHNEGTEINCWIPAAVQTPRTL